MEVELEMFVLVELEVEFDLLVSLSLSLLLLDHALFYFAWSECWGQNVSPAMLTLFEHFLLTRQVGNCLTLV
jgi:hypothetical protein